jgi:hypothetical protein
MLETFSPAGDRLSNTWEGVLTGGERLSNAWEGVSTVDDRLSNAWESVLTVGDRLSNVWEDVPTGGDSPFRVLATVLHLSGENRRRREVVSSRFFTFK